MIFNKRFLGTALFFFLSLQTVYADNSIEVFLTHDMKVTGIGEAQDKGLNIVYHYFDGVEQVEERMSKKATLKLGQEIKAIEGDIGLKKLSTMTEAERNQLLLKYMTSFGADVEQIRHSLVTPQDRDDINRALQTLVYANEQGITKEMLPAILFRGHLLKNTSDISKAFTKGDRS